MSCLLYFTLFKRGQTDRGLDAVTSQVQLDEWRQTAEVLDVFDAVAGQVQHPEITQMLQTFHHVNLHTHQSTNHGQVQDLGREGLFVTGSGGLRSLSWVLAQKPRKNPRDFVPQKLMILCRPEAVNYTIVTYFERKQTNTLLTLHNRWQFLYSNGMHDGVHTNLTKPPGSAIANRHDYFNTVDSVLWHCRLGVENGNKS